MSLAPLFLGIDPGDSSGGLGIIDSQGRFVDAIRTAGTPKNPTTSSELHDWLAGWHRDFGIAFAILEKVGAMPNQGLSSTFKFGKSLGRLEMVLVANNIPFEWATPAKWQGKMGCRTKGDKNVTKVLASELWPETKIFHWNADALIMAECARRTYRERGGLDLHV